MLWNCINKCLIMNEVGKMARVNNSVGYERNKRIDMLLLAFIKIHK